MNHGEAKSADMERFLQRPDRREWCHLPNRVLLGRPDPAHRRISPSGTLTTDEQQIWPNRWNSDPDPLSLEEEVHLSGWTHGEGADMNDHSHLLILGGVMVALAPFVLIGIGIASDYRTAHPHKPYRPHQARNVVLGVAVVIAASVVVARLPHHSPALTRAPVQVRSATGVPLAPTPTSVSKAPVRVAPPGARATTSPGSSRSTLGVPGSGLMTAFLSPVAKGTNVTTTPTPELATAEVTTTTQPSTATTATNTDQRQQGPQRPQRRPRARSRRPPRPSPALPPPNTTTTNATTSPSTTTTTKPPITITVGTTTITVPTGPTLPLPVLVP